MLKTVWRCASSAGYTGVWAAARQTRFYALKSPTGFDDETLRNARRWLADFTAVPSHLYDVSFSRSSGPGGQNVNKTNSKAMLKLPLASLLRELPEPLHAAVRQSAYATDKSESIVISSDESRKQADNVRACEAKLTRLVLDAGRASIPGETSEATKTRVRGMEKAANERRIRQKRMHSGKKSTRKSGGGADY